MTVHNLSPTAGSAPTGPVALTAIIPVAGAGTTLRPHTYTQPKPLIPVAGKPILGHIIDGLLQAGVQRFVFVVGYLGDKIQHFITQYAQQPQFEYHFVQQQPREGLAHAVALCHQHLLPGQPVVIALGDTIVDTDLRSLLHSPETALAVQKVETPWLFGVAEVDAAGGRITALVEKPSIPKSNLALVGVYKVNDGGQLLEACQHLIAHNQRTRNEFQLTDALMRMIEQGHPMRPHLVNKWYDCGQVDVLLETNRMLLNRTPGTAPDELLHRFPTSLFLPPVVVAPNCIIEHAIVGPHVAVGEHASIRHSIVEDSILGAYSHLEGIILKASVVGNDTGLKGRSQSINIGDNTEIDFNA